MRDLALSTHWNARRHKDGAALADEILALGFARVELGYDLTRDLVPGLQQRVREGALRVVSVHNYCPVPMGVARGGPEIFTFADPDPERRRLAVAHTERTLRFAAEMGAGAVVAHGGYIRHRRAWMPRLFAALEQDRYGAEVERWRARIERRRERRVRRALDALRACIEKLLPTLEETGVTLALENLPSWEAVPSETECRDLIEALGSPRLGYWHDTGHGRIRENCGFVNHARLFERLLPQLAGMHLHDVRYPAADHAMPPVPEGLDFSIFAAAANRPIPKVIEPAPGAPAEEIRRAAEHIARAWSAPRAAEAGS